MAVSRVEEGWEERKSMTSFFGTKTETGYPSQILLLHWFDVEVERKGKVNFKMSLYGINTYSKIITKKVGLLLGDILYLIHIVEDFKRKGQEEI